jgi:cysteine-rich secretory family protein
MRLMTRAPLFAAFLCVTGVLLACAVVSRSGASETDDSGDEAVSGGVGDNADAPAEDNAGALPVDEGAARPAVPPTPPAGAAGVSATQIQELVSAHNRWRAEVGVPNLSWSNAVAAGAQEWANQLAATGKFEHGSSEFGENLFGGSGTQTPTAAVDNWGSEKAQCNYHGEAIGTQSCRVGHYTQMVWSKTTELGCGVATTTAGWTTWVCRYNPRGNMSGEKPY